MVVLRSKVGFSLTWRVLECGKRVWKTQNNRPSASATSEAFGCRCPVFPVLAPACAVVRIGLLLSALSRLTHILKAVFDGSNFGTRVREYRKPWFVALDRDLFVALNLIYWTRDLLVDVCHPDALVPDIRRGMDGLCHPRISQQHKSYHHELSGHQRQHDSAQHRRCLLRKHGQRHTPFLVRAHPGTTNKYLRSRFAKRGLGFGRSRVLAISTCSNDDTSVHFVYSEADYSIRVKNSPQSCVQVDRSVSLRLFARIEAQHLFYRSRLRGSILGVLAQAERLSIAGCTGAANMQ